MADQSDVEEALSAIVGAALYPNGLVQPGAAGAACRIYRGWPTPAALEADLAAGTVNVTVTPVSGSTRITTRYPDEWVVPNPVVPALSAAVTGPTVTLAGAAGPGQLAALIVDGRAALHRTQAGDSPPSVAAALAAELRRLGAAPWNAAIAAGDTVTVPGAREIVARFVADQTATRETRRQSQRFAVVCWCPDPATRDRVGRAIETALSAIDFIALPDGYSGRLRFHDATATDRWQDATLYRRELIYSVDYATTITAVQPSLIVQGTQVHPNGQTPIATFLS